jgi:hypothetical protein
MALIKIISNYLFSLFDFLNSPKFSSLKLGVTVCHTRLIPRAGLDALEVYRTSTNASKATAAECRRI